MIDLEDPIKVGDQETYRITVTNQGSATDTNIKIVCTLEKNMTFVKVGVGSPTNASVSANGRTVTFEPLAALGAKQKKVWTLIVKVVSEGDVRFGVKMDSDQLGRPVSETEATTLYK